MHSFDYSNLSISNPVVLIGGVVIILALVAGVAIMVDRRRKASQALRAQFGAEYDLVVRESGSRSKAEARLHDRVKRVERLKVRDLDTDERDRYLAMWQTVQSRFVDHPRGAVTEADELVNSVMLARGFPSVGFERRAEDVSVHHARLVDSYRTANGIALRAARNEATTEELRAAMIHYRTLFEELLQVKTTTVREIDAVEATPLLRRSA